jgi:RNA polymerase sigma-70 factor (ECF subfamily)
MGEQDWLAEYFERERARLAAVAVRMLGSVSEAEDAVQETWIRLSRWNSDSSKERLGGWLTTVTARICLDMLRARKSKREESFEDRQAGRSLIAKGFGPEEEALLADSIGSALLLVLDTLAPAERVAFVLHDMFSIGFREIAPIIGRSIAATRQLASRARRRVNRSTNEPAGRIESQQQIVDAFLAASRKGDFEALLKVLDPHIVIRSDEAAARVGAPEKIRGREAVLGVFRGGSVRAQAALVEGKAGAVWAPRGRVKVAFSFTLRRRQIIRIDVIADPGRLQRLGLLSHGAGTEQ